MVPFWEEVTARQFCFEIYWPLAVSLEAYKLSKEQCFATQLCWVICAWAGQESYVCAAAKKLLSSCCSLHVARGPVTSVKWPSLRLLCYSSRTTDSQWEFFKISQMFLTIGHNIIIIFSTDAFARRECSLLLPPVKEGRGIIQLRYAPRS